jgi:hypothetical protein
VVAVVSCGANARADCDPSFVLSQPLFRTIVPEEGATDVAFKTPRVVIATDATDFSSVERIRLVPDSGQPLDLPVREVTARSADLAGIEFTSLYGKPAALAAIHPKTLAPSTTYELIFVVRTAAPQDCPRALTERVGSFTTEAASALDAFGDFAGVPDQPPTGAAAEMSGQAILDKTRDVLRTVRYPTYLSFIVHVRSNTGGKPFFESFRSIVRAQDDIVLTHKTPLETTSKPDNPYGTNFAILGFTIQTHTKGHQEEPFGVPQISPLYSFGLRPIGEMTSLGPTPPPEQSDIPSLGHVESIARDYDVTLVDIKPFGVRWAYHLRLVPLERPDVFRLRDMLVDTETFVPWEITSDGIFPKGPASVVPWRIRYTITQGAWLMTEETTSATLRVGGVMQGITSRGYDGLTYTFTDFAFTKTPSDFSFFEVGTSEASEY